MAENNASVLNLGKTHLSTVMKLSIPTILEQMVFSLFTFFDTAMVGILGSAPSAAVGLIMPLTWLLSGTASALGAGFSVITAHSIGEGDMKKASRSANESIWCGFVIGLSITIVCFLFSKQIPVWMGADPDVAKMSTAYFAVFSFTAVVNIVGTACSSTLRSTGETKLPLIINTCCVCLNILLNYLFIYPTRMVTWFGISFTMWGAGKGVGGAAFATLASISTSTFFLFFAVRHNHRGILIEFKEMIKVDREIYRRAFQIGMPIFLERMVISGGQLLYLRCISTLGTGSVATHHIAVQAESFSYMPVLGIQVAAQTLMSQSMGARRFEDGKKFGEISALVGTVYGCFAGIILFFFGGPIMSIFTKEAALIALGARIMKVVSWGEPMQAANLVFTGSLRGIGESKMPFYVAIVGIWGIRIVICLITTFVLHLGLEAAWVGMVLDMIFRGIATGSLFFIKYRKIMKREGAI